MNWSSEEFSLPDPRKVAAHLLLLNMHRTEVFSFVRKKIQPRAGLDICPDDILQDMYVLALEGRLLPSKQVVRKTLGYLNKIASNLLVTRIREGRRRREMQVNSEVATGPEPETTKSTFEPGVDDLAERGEVLDHVSRTLARLPRESATILTLRYLEGLSQKQICQRLGIKPETCAQRLNRAKKRFKKLF